MSESELDDLMGEVGGPCNVMGMVNMFQEKLAGDGNDPDELILQAFMAYDQGGKIDVKMFQHALTTWGDKMNKTEIDDIFLSSTLMRTTWSRPRKLSACLLLLRRKKRRKRRRKRLLRLPLLKKKMVMPRRRKRRRRRPPSKFFRDTSLPAIVLISDPKMSSDLQKHSNVLISLYYCIS